MLVHRHLCPTSAGTGHASSLSPASADPSPGGPLASRQETPLLVLRPPPASKQSRASGLPSLDSCTEMRGDSGSLRPHLSLRPPPSGAAWGPGSSWCGPFPDGSPLVPHSHEVRRRCCHAGREQTSPAWRFSSGWWKTVQTPCRRHGVMIGSSLCQVHSAAGWLER